MASDAARPSRDRSRSLEAARSTSSGVAVPAFGGVATSSGGTVPAGAGITTSNGVEQPVAPLANDNSSDSYCFESDDGLDDDVIIISDEDDDEADLEPEGVYTACWHCTLTIYPGFTCEFCGDHVCLPCFEMDIICCDRLQHFVEFHRVDVEQPDERPQ